MGAEEGFVFYVCGGVIHTDMEDVCDGVEHDVKLVCLSLPTLGLDVCPSDRLKFDGQFQVSGLVL